MSGFVANSPAVAEDDIANTDFYPAISPSACREAMRIDQSITPQRLNHALVGAIIDVNDNLKSWKADQEATGHTTLEDTPGDTIDGVNAYVTLYKRAVYCWAKAELVERYRDYDSTLNGTQRAESLEETIEQYRRQAIIAIRAISGRQRTTVELI
ncbi:head completion/stabilization protein [Marinobacterium sedimentorum]|uniref:head completion/stabilization protein n=1 Tax=Marinobacterium sedimentorum TaxID=2927804 RepID=UPI0020C63CF4|nr:head completion/stabilization protein [Marinobacterium sedimentorum]MCP8687764.1 head completion/stabilization protein [Marinobacterium sedimentorum]